MNVEDAKWGSHIPALRAVLESCGIQEVVEIGCGLYSTPLWGDTLVYCEDTNKSWIDKIKKEIGVEVTYFEGIGEDKNFVSYSNLSVEQKQSIREHYQRVNARMPKKGKRLLFVDGAAYLRGIAANELGKDADVIVIHDTQGGQDNYYGWGEAGFLSRWKRYDCMSPGPATTIWMPERSQSFEDTIDGKITEFDNRFNIEWAADTRVSGREIIVNQPDSWNDKVLAFSLYGNKKCYYEGALKVIGQCKVFYPDFEIRFYMPSSAIKLAQFNGYEFPGVNIVECREAPGCIPSLYRLLAFEDRSLMVCLVRDLDSDITQREVNAVNEWLDSGAEFHIMRDHPHHLRPINSGMLGFKQEFVQKIGLVGNIVTMQIDEFLKTNKSSYGIDEVFLENVVWPLVCKSSMVHVGNGGARFDPMNEKEMTGDGMVGDLNETRQNTDTLYMPGDCEKMFNGGYIHGTSTMELESYSGNGSYLENTRFIRVTLPVALKVLGVKSFLDMPCGDGNWIRHVNFGDISYKGVDISAVAANLARKNGLKNVDTGSLMSYDFGDVDFLFIRDCLVHLPNKMVKDILERICKSGVKYVGMTHFFANTKNDDIPMGQWRPLNMCLSPFGLPVPVLVLSEGYTQQGGAYWDKSIGIWKVESLRVL